MRYENENSYSEGARFLKQYRDFPSLPEKAELSAMFKGV
jgi:hypothetical protein